MVLVLVITAVVFLIVFRLLFVFADNIKFFSTGLDAGFTFSEISLFWKLAKRTELEDPLALYVSLPTLNRTISAYLADVRQRGTENTPEVQELLKKLYKYRTKIDIEHENRRGLDSSKYLAKGQKLRLILPGHGVFASEILNNGTTIAIRLPTQDKIIKVKSDGWMHKTVSVYLWRKGDAGYVFDTRVVDAGIYNGTPAIQLAQTNKLLRTQKRKSVRAECSLPAALYFMSDDIMDFAVETEPGYKCLLEDISEDGAMIRVGGLGRNNVKIKIQFVLAEKMIIMYGIVRAVEYNKTHNQSRLHFECVNTTDDMRNMVLSYVYDVLPQEAKDVFEALSETEADREADETAPEEQTVTLADAEKHPAAPHIAITMPEIKAGTNLDSLAELSVEEEDEEV